ncbi:MAG TPA: transglycosylase SLT domain-containing protein [Parvibaculum sp.]
MTGKKSETATAKPVIGWRIAAAMGLALAVAPTLALSQTQRPTTEISSALAKPSPWTYCERATVLIEAAHKMPRALLFSVAMVESGRLNPELRKPRPWPWTINAEGQSFYFKTKKDAIAATRRLLKEGVRSIDVGCMQINLRYHPDAFADLNEAFDPAANVTYGAKFLKTLHERTDSWPEAIATYHSQSKTRNAPYFARVIGVWTDEHTRIAALARRLKAEAIAQADAPTRELPVQAVAETPVETVVVASQARPAPMVLDGDVTSTVRETAVATVGLRLSIADDDFAATQKTQQTAPRVIDTPRAAPTVLADASPNL